MLCDVCRRCLCAEGGVWGLAPRLRCWWQPEHPDDRHEPTDRGGLVVGCPGVVIGRLSPTAKSAARAVCPGQAPWPGALLLPLLPGAAPWELCWLDAVLKCPLLPPARTCPPAQLLLRAPRRLSSLLRAPFLLRRRKVVHHDRLVGLRYPGAVAEANLLGGGLQQQQHQQQF
jgi:hypothetical protein